MTRTIHLGTVLALAVLVVGGGAIALNANPTLAQAQAGNQNVTSMTSVSVDNQTSDNRTVIVDAVNLSEGGFVAIHDQTLQENDTVGSVIGVSLYLEAGSHENVPVTLATPLNETEGNVTVIAMLHRDTNSNQAYDFVLSNGTVDGAYLTNESAGNATNGAADNATNGASDNATNGASDNVTSGSIDNVTNGSAVTDSAQVMVDADVGPRMNLSFANQTSNGSVVTVDNVTLYRGGYVVIHDDTLNSGETVDSVIGSSAYLEPGTYENLQVRLAEPLNATNATNGTNGTNETENNITLIAMPHHETNENLVYDFVLSNGTEDGPYTVNGSAVTAQANVTVGEEEPVTPTTPDDTDNPTTPEETDSPTTPEETDSPTTPDGTDTSG